MTTENGKFSTWLNAGSMGWEVVVLQILLRLKLLSTSVSISGYYGNKTVDGVCKWQRMLGVEVDGNFGQDTRKKIIKRGGLDFNTLLAAVFRTKAERKKLFRESLCMGDNGSDVAVLQCYLRDNGHNDNIVVDGKYGNETKKGVISLQRFFLIKGVGDFDSTTNVALFENTGFDLKSLSSDIFQGENIPVGP
ncbi:MAG: peptidoglycan-binding protein [Parcubacteria group bacterium]|jgi:peptidoglycan hydrolase-like protein with peptidoglycan-binding domain